MAIEPLGLREGQRMPLTERDFPVAKHGYDQGAVKGYLAGIEAYLSELEAWTKRVSARLSIAEEQASAAGEIDSATVAIFETRDRVLEEAQARAKQIEAEAAVRARASQEQAVARILADARAQANRIIQTALDGVDHARSRELGPAPLALTESPEPVPPSSEQTLPDVFQLSSNPDVDWHEPLQPEKPGDGADRQSRYERTSAKLPSIGEDASKVYGSLHRLRPEDD